MIDDIKKDAEDHMKKTLDSVDAAFRKIRTGRAHPGVLDSVMVPYYGNNTPLKQVANVAVEDGRTLAVIPWEKQLIPVIEKAIKKADLGLNPSSNSELIRVPLPALTEETRKDMIKVARNEAEQGRVAIRGIRRNANSDLKELLKEREISEDEERKGQDLIQKLTDKYVAAVDTMLQKKESELMAV